MTLEELKSMHWSQLKKMVEDNGGQWETKEKAVQFLVDAGLTSGDEGTNDEGGEEVTEKPSADVPVVKVEVAPKTKAKVVLDRSKPFGDVYGEVEGYPTARYSQGEHLFNAAGERL